MEAEVMPQNPTDPNWGATQPAATNTKDPNWGLPPVVTAHISAAPPAEGLGPQLGRAALNALPAVGGIVGGALSTPETLGAGTIPGVALGVGAGRGLRDVLAEMFGLDQPTSAASKGGRIALDTAEAAVLQGLMPGLVEAAKAPRQTVSDLIDALPVPKWLKPVVPSQWAKAPAKWLLQRPAWQTWEAAAAEAPPTAPPTITAGKALPADTNLPEMFGVPMETAAAPAMSPQRILNELALAARRAKITLSGPDYDALVATVKQGAAPADAIAGLVKTRLAPIEQLAGSSAFAGLPSTADMEAAVASRNSTGQWSVPKVDSKARWAAERAAARNKP